MWYILFLHTLWENCLLLFFCYFSRCVWIKIFLCNFRLHRCFLCLFAQLWSASMITLLKTLFRELGPVFFFFMPLIVFPCILLLYIHIIVNVVFMLFNCFDILFVFLEVYIFTVHVKRLAVACNIGRLINPMYYYYYYWLLCVCAIKHYCFIPSNTNYSLLTSTGRILFLDQTK